MPKASVARTPGPGPDRAGHPTPSGSPRCSHGCSRRRTTRCRSWPGSSRPDHRRPPRRPPTPVPTQPVPGFQARRAATGSAGLVTWLDGPDCLQMARLASTVAGLLTVALIARPAEVLDRPPGGGIRLISSQVPQPTSPSQTSLVPGRVVMQERVAHSRWRRSGRRCWSTRGVPPGKLASQCSRTIRITVPFRVTGSPEVRRVLGAQGAALVARRSLSAVAAGITGLTVVNVVETGPVSRRSGYSAPSAPKARSPTEWLGNC